MTGHIIQYIILLLLGSKSADLMTKNIIHSVMVFIWSERSGRSRPTLQKCRKADPPKKCREASTTKKCHKAAPPKKCRKEGRLKICSKCNPPQKCCEAALQTVPCYVYVAPTKNVKAAPLKKYHKAATTKCFTAATLKISLQAPPDIKTITEYIVSYYDLKQVRMLISRRSILYYASYRH